MAVRQVSQRMLRYHPRDPDERPGTVNDQKRLRQAQALAAQGRVGEAIALLSAPGPRGLDTWIELGVLHDRNADARSALDAAQRVERLSPQHPVGPALAARALTALGRIDEAAAAYRRMARLPGQAARAWFGLLDLKTEAVTEKELGLIEDLVAHPRTTDDDRMMAGYALGHAYEKAGRPSDAVRAYEAASRFRRAQIPWDAAGFSRVVDALRDAFPEPAPLGDETRGGNVIFVVGMARSGTTLVEQILAAHPEVVGASELPWLAQILAAESARRSRPFPSWLPDASDADWERLGREYLARTERWHTRSRFTDKMPENWLYVGPIRRMLPGARIVGCERDPVETAWSCFKQLFAPGMFGWSYDYESLARYAADSRWLWRHWARQEPGHCLTLSYEALVADFQPQVQALLAFLGLPYDPACLDFPNAPRETRSASAAQVRRPLDRGTARRASYGTALDALADAVTRAARDVG